jgi:hypothetical protein
MSNKELKEFIQVIEAARVLNIYAGLVRDSKYKDFLYSLKNGMIEFLYRERFAVGINLYEQTTRCSNISHRLGIPCPVCSGTNIYKTNMIYGYTFDIGGYRFSWHQPRNQALTMPRIFGTVMTEKNSEPHIVDFGNVNAKSRLVWTFLRSYNIPVRKYMRNKNVAINERKGEVIYESIS